MDDAHNDSGFTLAEMLVALALLSLTFTGLAAALSFAIRANDIAAATDFRQNAFAANQFLRNTISRSQALYIQLPSGSRRKLQFQGSKMSIRFVANLPGWTTVAGMHVVDIAFLPPSTQAGSGKLISKFAPYRPMQTGDPKFYQPSTILRNVTEIEFTYFGAKKQGQQPEWHRAWSDANRLPHLVTVSATFKAPHTGVWPVTVIRLFASQAPRN